MSTAKKVAIGVGVAAAVAGISYYAIKSGKVPQISRGAKAVAKSRVNMPSAKLTGYTKRINKNYADLHKATFYRDVARKYAKSNTRSLADVDAANSLARTYSNRAGHITSWKIYTNDPYPINGNVYKPIKKLRRH